MSIKSGKNVIGMIPMKHWLMTLNVMTNKYDMQLSITWSDSIFPNFQKVCRHLEDIVLKSNINDPELKFRGAVIIFMMEITRAQKDEFHKSSPIITPNPPAVIAES